MKTCSDCLYFVDGKGNGGICSNEILGRRFLHIPFVPCHKDEPACWAFEFKTILMKDTQDEVVPSR